MLRNLFKDNAFLYRIWFVLIRTRQTKGKKKLPQATDHLFFTGYPRSGNTYLSGLIRYCLTDMKFTDHLHTVASIKIALSKNLKTFVIIRNPQDSVASYLSFHSKDMDTTLVDEEQVERFLSDYYRYFRFLNDKKDLLHFISFENMIVDRKSTIEAIADVLGLSDFRLTDDLLEDFENKMRKVETRKDTNAGSLPNAEKQAYKANVSSLIRANDYFPRCLELFNSLEALTINAVR